MTREKAAWDARQAERTRVQLETERAQQEENERRRQAEEELRETVHNEERKKYKNKFAPVVDAPLPIGPVHIPSRIALTRMKKGRQKNNNSFVFVHDEDADTATLVPASSVADSCSSALVEDVDLSWEDFMQATPRMIESMELNDWPQDRVNVFIEFWSNHPWRHSDDTFSRRALLVYQGIQRKRWHIAIGTKQSWSLAKICTVTLAETRQDLVRKAHVQQINRLQRVSSLPFTEHQ
ncbi:hypothetical protein EDD15DRAFT_2204334 [Pisolithus albus]|nr:hypothetical protein EDD15DRAFT_2204334 [Pisolithus albus]